MPVLHKGTKRKISIPIKKTEDLVSGSFKVLIQVNGSTIFDFRAAIDKTEVQAPQPETNTVTLFNPGLRERTTNDGTYVVDFFLFSNTSIKENDIKVFKNKKPVVDGKSIPRLVKTEEENGRMKYILSFELYQLDDGANEIEVSIGEETASMIINYLPKQPNLHLLAIGPHYEDLKYTTKDAKDFTNLILNQANNGLFNEVSTVDTLFQPSNTDKISIESAFYKLDRKFEQGTIAENDYLIVYLSAHGINLKDGYHILPTDFKPNLLEPTSINYKKDIVTYLNRINCKKLIFIDACLSGSIEGAKSVSAIDLNEAIIKANQSIAGLTVFSSSASKQLSYEFPDGENGLFTEALLEALSGAADQSNSNDFVINIEELIQYLEKRVPELAKMIGLEDNQTPFMIGDLPKDLPIIIIN